MNQERKKIKQLNSTINGKKKTIKSLWNVNVARIPVVKIHE